MSAFAIWYGDGSVVRGRCKKDWDLAPDDDVQVVVHYIYSPRDRHPFHDSNGVQQPKDRQILTGLDEYSILGWRKKSGKLMEKDAYMALFDVAMRG